MAALVDKKSSSNFCWLKIFQSKNDFSDFFSHSLALYMGAVMPKWVLLAL